MIRRAKSILLAIGFLVIISFLLPGCYTQLSRPQVDTDDEYYDNSEYEDAEEYYQDEGVPPADDSRDVYIYNYYPYSYYDYYDYWYWYHNPYARRYVGPYPDYWWDPYARWWTPGWYVGFSYYDYYWGGYTHYYGSYYRYGYYGGKSNRTFSKRPFDRRSIGLVDRNRRIDTRSSLTKPISPNRVKRPGTTLATPIVRDKSLSPDRKSRTVKEMVDQRLRSRTKTTQLRGDAKKRTVTRQRSDTRTYRTVKNPPRSSKITAKPKMIRRVPSKSTPQKNHSVPRRSSTRKSTSISRSSNSRSRSISKPATRSYTPRSSSSSRSTTRSTPTRSSSGKSSSSGSKSSKSSTRTKK